MLALAHRAAKVRPIAFCVLLLDDRAQAHVVRARRIPSHQPLNDLFLDRRQPTLILDWSSARQVLNGRSGSFDG